MIDIVALRSNSIIYNPRVRKIYCSLKKKYSVSILGWNREGISKEKINSFSPDLRVFNMTAPYGKSSLLLYYPLYWIWVFIWLVRYRPKAVHACDLDTVLPCYIYKTIFRKKLVFDVCDRYAMTYAHIISRPGSAFYKIMYSIVNGLEELFAEKADVLINVSGNLLRTFRRKPKHCAVIMNCAEDRLSDFVKYKKKYNKTFRIAYTGLVRSTRGIEEVISAIQGLDDVELVIAGRLLDIDLLHRMSKSSNVKYIGLLSPDEALILAVQSDVSVVFYDLREPINAYSMGNKIFEAMMLGLPVITNVAHEMVNEVGYAITVNYHNANQIRDAIILLKKDKDLLAELGKNARKGFLNKYNWMKMEEELHSIYNKLLER